MSAEPLSNLPVLNGTFAVLSDGSQGPVATLAHSAEGHHPSTLEPQYDNVVPPMGPNITTQDSSDSSTNAGEGPRPAQPVITSPGVNPSKDARPSIVRSCSSTQQPATAFSSASPLSTSPYYENIQPPNRPRDLWSEAYDRLKVEEPALVQKYEKILSQSLQASNLSSTSSNFEEVSQIVGAKMKEMETAKWDLKFGGKGALQSIMSAKNMIASALQASPQASLAWAGVSVVVSALSQSKPETAARLKDLEYISQRIEWYQNWSDILLKDNIDVGKLSPRLQHALEERLIDLFKALLSFQIKIIYSTSQSSSLTFLRDTIKFNDRDADMKAIKDAELAIRQDVELAMLLRQQTAMEAVLDNVTYDGLNSQDDSNETFVVQLWGRKPIEADIAHTKQKMHGNISWLELQKPLDADILQGVFPWCIEELSSKSEQSPPTPGDNYCALIVRRLKTPSAGLTSFMEPPPLFGPRVLDKVMKFLNLPDEYRITRRNDCGTCKKIIMPSKNRQGYIIQTPFYSGGYWSLLISHTKDPTEGDPDIAGVFQADSDVNLDDIFSEVKKATENYKSISARDCGHPMLLPIQLFSDHFITTQKKFQDTIKDIHTVELEIQKELTGDKDQNHGSAESSVIDYGALSRLLHISSTAAVELGRRRDFERRLGVLLKEEIAAGSILANAVSIYSEMSTSRDLDIQSLPHRIESQRNVLTSLIAQRDNETQQDLARAANNDSKAVKTISILTILFLPGAYVATLFTTNMFAFQDGEEVWVYWAIVVPLTFLVLTIWAIWMWLSRSPSKRPDIETGRLRLFKRGIHAGRKNKKH